jgi:uncharacterized protein with von Willebrand factor type A (vWA) domain
VFRQVCSNGAIFAQAVQSCHLTDLELRTPDEAETALHEAISACCAREAFEGAFSGMRSALARSVDERQAREIASMLINITQSSSSRNGETDGQLFELFLRLTEGFGRQGDRTRYALLNTVTATARDTREPAVRWRLEELGGAIASSRLGERPRQFDGFSIKETVAV